MFRFEITTHCKACGKCAKKCPAKAISKVGRKYEIDQEQCIHCGACYARCSKGAILRWDSENEGAPPQINTQGKKKKGHKKKKGLLHRLRRLLGEG
jgi:uncharacterized Fe-S center protein